MGTQREILNEIKSTVHQHVPGAKIFLFGSRAKMQPHEESDWDILILTPEKYPKTMRWRIQDVLFPLSVKLHSFINIKMAEETDWNTNPSYYSLRLDLSKNKPLAL
jgi:predicted nucleotidyltransferase